MPPLVNWRDYKTSTCTARVALVGSHLVSECTGYLDGPLATIMVGMCAPMFQMGNPLGAFHVWDTKSYEPAFRIVWMDYMKQWGTKYFRDLNIYVPPGLARMGMSVAATMRIGDIHLFKSKEELLAARFEALAM